MPNGPGVASAEAAMHHTAVRRRLPPAADKPVRRRLSYARGDGDVEDGVFYPCDDGLPMSENDWQFVAIVNAVCDLKIALPEAKVMGNMLLYPERGNPHNTRAPDVMVARGVPRHKRNSYRVWQEGKPPDWVLEVASDRTVEVDVAEKRQEYAEVGVPEYWLFDPKGTLFEAGEPRLQGLALVPGVPPADAYYEPLEARIERGQRVIHSDALRLDVRIEDELLRFSDPRTKQDVRHHFETEALVEEAAAAQRAAEARRADAEARVAELEAELRDLRARR